MQTYGSDSAEVTSAAGSAAVFKSSHFAARQRQRQIADTWVWAALRFGQPFYQGGDRVFFLGRKQLDRARRATGGVFGSEEAKKADGTVVVVGPDNTLVTTYRNPHYIRHLRRCDA